MAATNNDTRVKQTIRSMLTAPHFTALIPIVMIIAYWNGGEDLMILVALLFPALLALGGALTRVQSDGPSIIDPASGLPHKNKLVQVLERGFVSEADYEKVCIGIDIDDFDVIKAALGEDEADKISAEIAHRIKSLLRREDMVCALGTGRFGIALDKGPRTDLEAVLQLAARLQAVIDEPLVTAKDDLHLSACIGFVMPSRSPEFTGEALLAACESALQVAQASGPGSIRAFSADMPARSAGNTHAKDDLEHAFDNDQIKPWFQPQICTNTGKFMGCEALVRWEHPTLGLIAPGAFLPAISKFGLLDRLGEVMLFEALTHLRDADRRRINIPTIAVNFSSEELCNPKLYDKIRWELDRFEISPDRLVIEILENVVATGADDIVTRNIKALAQLGCKIDLDDFGTGHAAISSIRHFNVHRIKIDRSFVTHVDTDRDQQSMVAAILTMATQLGVETVAEGVETHGEHAMLAQLGCEYVQGYVIAKPMPFSDLCQWIDSHTDQLPAMPPLQKQA